MSQSILILWVLKYFMSQNMAIPGSSYSFCVPVLESSISSKSPGSSQRAMVLRNQDLDSGCAHCCQSAVVVRPSEQIGLGSVTFKKLWVYTNTSNSNPTSQSSSPPSFHSYISLLPEWESKSNIFWFSFLLQIHINKRLLELLWQAQDFFEVLFVH